MINENNFSKNVTGTISTMTRGIIVYSKNVLNMNSDKLFQLFLLKQLFRPDFKNPRGRFLFCLNVIYPSLAFLFNYHIPQRHNLNTIVNVDINFDF